MKILLVRPPAKYIKGGARPAISLPLGLLYLAAVLEKNHYLVEIYDAQINLDQPIYSDSAGNLHMGDKWEDVANKISKSSPDLVGITCPFTTQIDNVIKTAEIIKNINKDIVTVVGGNYPSIRPADFLLQTKAIDIVCRGEGEYTALEIAEAVENKKDLKEIFGIAVRDGEQVKITPPRPPIQNLDELPFPAYHLVNLEDYFRLIKKGFTDRPIWTYPGFERAVSVITSRGCPFNCIFCSIYLHMGKKWRFHSAEYMLKHLEFLVSKYNIKHIHFEDDNLTFGVDRFKGILTGLIQSKLSLTWDTPNGIRADIMTNDILKDCKKSGCLYLIFGVESGNQEVLDKIVEKRLDLNKVIKAAAWCKELSLDVGAFFVIGFPGESKQNMKETIDFALRLHREYDVTPGLFIATPLPGTRLEAIFMEKGLLKSKLSPENLAKMTQGIFLMDGDKFRAEDLNILQKRFYKGYKRNFIRNALFFFLRHPKAIFKFISKLYKEKGFKISKEYILNILEFKNCLIRNFPKD